MAKKKPPINCSTCFYSIPTKYDIDVSLCRRYPEHRRLPVTHWCGEYLNEQTGADLIVRDPK